MKTITFYLFIIIIILVLIYVLVNSNADIKSTIAYIIAFLSFFFGPGAFFKIKDWWFSKSLAKLIMKNNKAAYSYEAQKGILQSYSIDIWLINVGEITVIESIYLDTDKGLFRMR